MKYIWIGCLTLILMISCKQKEETYTIETEYGKMIVQLLNTTPKHKENFIKLVNEGFYDSLLFHRVVNGSLIQGGDPTSKTAKPREPLGSHDVGYMIPAEIGTPHFRGMLAAARQGGDANPDKLSSGSQFYIVQGVPVNDEELGLLQAIRNFKYSDAQLAKYKKVGGIPMLDNDYTVFGEVIQGLDVLEKISMEPTDDLERPYRDIRMKIYKTP
ncbi:MAG: peptidylprolyl isomerase [Chitinophagales bacterium]|nr:peptidylprolyl isomerase [Chitinophagales bacterium]